MGYVICGRLRSVPKFNPCILKQQKNEALSFPAPVFGYLAMCENLRQKIKKVSENAITQTNNLPFVSPITTKFSPQSAVYIHWSYLKY